MTEKLRKASKVIFKIAHFLNEREWSTEELTAILERANAEIEQIQQSAIASTIAILENYRDECSAWSTGNITDINGNPIKAAAADRRKAQTELKKIDGTISKLEEIL